jgi:hypothetical protein
VKSWRRPPGLSKLLQQAASGKSKPTAFILAGLFPLKHKDALGLVLTDQAHGHR